MWLPERKCTGIILFFNHISDMSQHTSFRAVGGASTKKRNVLKRFERVQLLKRRGLFVDQPGARVTGLVKTKPDA